MKPGARVRIAVPERHRLSAFDGIVGVVLPDQPSQLDDELAVEIETGWGPSYLYVEKLYLREETQLAADEKATNPKDAIASGKLPLHLWPKTASIGGALALLDGMLKYGRTNWRVAGVKASVYVDALERHVTRWFEGEETDSESGLPHLWHALACLAILVDAQAANKLVDDRQYPGGFERMLEESTPHVARLNELRADKNPKHYTRADV